MGCERPFTLRNPQGGTLQAKCGHCRGCLIQDISDWSLRLKNELKHCFNAYFVTLTYSDEYNTGEVEKADFQKFIKDLRNIVTYWDKTQINLMPEEYDAIRYFGCGEYGANYLRPHYHIIIFNIPIFAMSKNHNPNHVAQVKSTIDRAWGKGFTSIDTVNDGTIHYTCKYIFKQANHEIDDLNPPFRLMSKRPAIGYRYIEEAKGYHWTGKYFVNSEGYKVHLPRFYSNKIFDDEMKEQRKEHFEKLAYEKDIENYYKPAIENIRNAEFQRQVLKIKDEKFKEKFKKSKL